MSQRNPANLCQPFSWVQYVRHKAVDWQRLHSDIYYHDILLMMKDLRAMKRNSNKAAIWFSTASAACMLLVPIGYSSSKAATAELQEALNELAVSGEFRIRLNRQRMGSSGNGSNPLFWAMVIGHEMHAWGTASPCPGETLMLPICLSDD